MKLVQLLAKKLKEWPENIEFLAQHSNGRVFGWIGLPIYYNDQWILNGDCDIFGFAVVAIDLSDDYKSSLVTKAQWQAEREKMNKPKWIRHRGGNSTLHPGTMVEARLRSGEIQRAIAGAFLWDNSLSDHAVNIMAYRVIEETKDQEIEEVETIDTAKAPTIEYAFGDKDSDPKDLDWKQLGTLTSKLEIDATGATQQIDSLVAKWGQIESPIKWRDEIIELEAYEEEFRREREKLIRKLESEGFKLIDHINCNLDKIDQTLDNSSDMSDWRNWRAGDTVECLVVPGKHTGYYFSGENYNIRCVDLDDEGTSSEVDIYCAEGFSLWCPSSSFKFVSRP